MMMREKTRSLHFVVAAVILLISGCGKGDVSNSSAKGNSQEAEAKSSGKVEGSLTVNGKTEALMHLYARRVDARPVYGGGAAIEVLLTNKPISEELLKKIFEETDKLIALRNERVVKGSLLTAVHFRIPKEQYRKNRSKVSSDGTLVTPEHFSGGRTSHEFQEFDLRKGVIKAKAEKEWDEKDFSNGTKVQCSYSLSFEASLGEPNVLPAKSGKLPDQGTATGKMTTKDGSAAELKYAYAWKEQLFFDEPDEKTVVLVIDKPLPNDKKAQIIDNVTTLGRYGLQGVIIMINEFGQLYSGYIISPSELMNTNLFENVEYAVENGRVKGNADYRERGNHPRDFSFTFDAPLKN